MKIEQLSLYALKYFFDTVENGSLTKAADINFVTRPAISQSISRLEEWAGYRLITHQKKKFELTKKGESFYHQMKASYLDFSASLSKQKNLSRHVSIGCSASLAEVFLFPVLKKLKPITELQLKTGTSRQLTLLMSEESINMAMFISESKNKNKNSKTLYTGNFILAAPSAKKFTQIITTEERPEVLQLKKYLKNKKEAAVSFLEVESWSLSIKLASELGCACFIPDFLLPGNFQKIEMRGLNYSYHVVLEHQDRVKLSDLELGILDMLT